MVGGLPESWEWYVVYVDIVHGKACVGYSLLRSEAEVHCCCGLWKGQTMRSSCGLWNHAWGESMARGRRPDVQLVPDRTVMRPE